MALLLKKAWINYDYFINDMIDERVKDWFLMGSTIPLLIILTAYLYFVKSIGPKMMKKRKAFNLDKIIIFYNIIQIILCSITVYRLTPVVLNINWWCAEISYESDPLSIMIVRTGHLYFVTKVLDLLDTVFFVLRKKQNQITFLHVYHHSIICFAVWIAVRYFGGGHNVFFPYVNSFVHIVMYAYYLATAWNKELKKNPWWKKYITQLQLVQFTVLLVLYILPLVTKNCNFPKIPLYMMIPQNFFMTIMFGDFYYNTYIKKRTNKST